MNRLSSSIVTLCLLLCIGRVEGAITFLHHFNDPLSFDANSVNGDFASGDATAAATGSPSVGTGFFPGSSPGNNAFRYTHGERIDFDSAGGNVQLTDPTSGGITVGFWFRFENPTPGAGNHGAQLLQIGAPALDDDHLRLDYSYGPGGLLRSIHRDGSSLNNTTIQTTLGNDSSDWTYVAASVDLTNRQMSVYRYDESGVSLGALTSPITVDGWNLATDGTISVGRGLFGADAVLIDELSIDGQVLAESEISMRVASMVAGNQLQAVESLKSGDPGFGKQWIRENDFTVMADGVNSITWDLEKYMGAGLSAVFRERGSSSVFWAEDANAAGVPWHGFASTVAEFNSMNTTPGAAAWMIGDEPAGLEMSATAAVLAHARARSPNTLIYTNAKAWGSDASLWGSSRHPAYGYEEYLHDIINIVKPDVLMYDQYPFIPNTEELFNLNGGYFGEMMMVREKAIEANLPYWAWVQAYDETRDNPYDSKRRPSESDMRMQVFAYLAAGFTGFNTWTYDGHPGRSYYGLIDFDGFPTPQYYFAAEAFAEAKNIGRVTRFLTSEDVRFVPGQSSEGVTNPTPDGIDAWTANAGENSHVLSIGIEEAGPGKDGLMGFFSADDGQQYFMLTNLYHAEELSSAEASLRFVIQFDSSVDSLLRLNRETGLQERILLENSTLLVTLPGGTGELFKYDVGNFVGLPDQNADFNGDGYVDGNDFLVWQRGIGSTTASASEGDANGDMKVDGVDLEVWKSQFGMSASLPASSTSVPEPNSGLIFVLGCLLQRFRFGSQRDSRQDR